MTAPDAAVSEWITGFSSEFSAVEGFMSVLVSDFFIPVSISLYMLFLWFGTRDAAHRERNQYGIMCASAALGFACLVIEVVNNSVEMWARPFEVDAGARAAAEAIFYLPHDPSFPANLAGVSFGAAMGIFIYNRKASIPVFVLAVIWSVSRVYAGVHYPLDILGGAAIGMVTAFFSYGLLRVFHFIPEFCLNIGRKLYLA
ncbi:MAG: phosphatase PAP2 family protein [Dehalococcoidia bacterium]